MNTFHPFIDHYRTASVLDVKRRAKQIVECKQILQLLEARRTGQLRNADGKLKGHINHPNVIRWEGYENELINYMATVHEAHERRKYGKWLEIATKPKIYDVYPVAEWLTEEFCKEHRKILYKKQPEHYQQFWNEEGEVK